MSFSFLPYWQLSSEDVLGIKQEIAERNFHFYHFTSFENLTSILLRGLVPRSSDVFGDISATLTDFDRKLHGATCLSVGFPNYKLRFSKSQQMATDFAILKIEPKILLTKTWFACSTNSTKTEISQGLEKNPMAFCGIGALQKIFADNLQTINGSTAVRSQLKIDPSYSTDPQAEVIFDETIEAAWIQNVYFESETLMANFVRSQKNSQPEWKLIHPSSLSKFDVNKKLFEPRIDWRFWQRGNCLVAVETED